MSRDFWLCLVVFAIFVMLLDPNFPGDVLP